MFPLSLKKRLQSLKSLINHSKFYSKSEKFRNHINSQKSELENEIEALNESIKKQLNEEKNKENPDHSGKAFIVIQTRFMAETIYDTYNSWFGFRKSKFPNTQLHPDVDYAAHPDELLRENLYFDSSAKKFRRTFIFFIEVLLFSYIFFFLFL